MHTPDANRPEAETNRIETGEIAAPLRVAEASIVCGTDFSEQATEAVKVAAAFATHLDERLVLAHAVHWKVRGPLPQDLHDSLCVYERAQFYRELESARAAGAKVDELFQIGTPDELLPEAARERGARLLVVASRGRQRTTRGLLGSVAARVAQAAPVPTLIVREAEPFSGWFSGRQPLRVLVGADLSAPADAALRWVAWLRQLGPCHVTVAYFQPEPSAWDALCAIPSASMSQEMLDKTDRTRLRMFRDRVRELLDPVHIRTDHGWSRSDAYLVHEAQQADLLVVGTHRRHGVERVTHGSFSRGVERVTHGSFSRGVVRYCQTNVACVPCAQQPGDA